MSAHNSPNSLAPPHCELAGAMRSACVAVELCMNLSYPKLDDPNGLTCAASLQLTSTMQTLDVYWQTAGATSQIHLPTLLRNVRRPGSTCNDSDRC